ncbi:15102_t:CDS:2 [Entrophospora sp. SA101]|nr:15102_t:CDS:2 [Entrophospora sp. SA101]
MKALFFKFTPVSDYRYYLLVIIKLKYHSIVIINNETDSEGAIGYKMW